MLQSKPWYMSKTVWASLVSVAATFGSLLGIDVPEETQRQLSDAMLQLVVLSASLMAIFGRLTASATIE